MRDKKRIKIFCDEFARIWEQAAPDWRFGQLISNVLGDMQANGKDIFYPEEEEMIEYIKKWFSIS